MPQSAQARLDRPVAADPGPCPSCGSAQPHTPCPDCGAIVHLGQWPFCPHGSVRAARNAPNVYTGKLIWLGSEVYGAKRLQSDEHRADVEASCLRLALTSEEMDLHAND